MKNTMLVLLTTALLPGCAFAIDGQVLINQSTVMAAGGFPYRITQPGSYKLTGNLTMTTTVSGNSNGGDVAISIESSQVTLDLNGFTIYITNNFAFPNHNYYAIVDFLTGRTFVQVVVRNGNITASSASDLSASADVAAYGIYLPNTRWSRFEDITIYFEDHTRGPNARALAVPTNYILRGVLTNWSSGASCPSILFMTTGVSAVGSGCVVNLVN